jgi:Spy/CpxP family protein refolding chaperone
MVRAISALLAAAALADSLASAQLATNYGRSIPIKRQVGQRVNKRNNRPKSTAIGLGDGQDL